MKQKFELECIGKPQIFGQLQIIGTEPKYHPYMAVTIGKQTLFVKDIDLRLLATNILKALKEKK